MATYTVNRVHKGLSANGTHEHVEAICTTANLKYTRDQVIASINGADDWYTSVGGRSAKIIVVNNGCGRCHLKPYIRTTADSTTSDNLLSLPAC
jgi:hypothetical protein